MRNKSAFNNGNLFDRLPTSASIGLSLSAISAFATLFQGITTVFRVPGFYSNFFYGTVSDSSNLSQRLGLIIIIWAILQLTAIYLAMGARPIARIIVVSMAGVNLLGFISLFVGLQSVTFWDYVLMSILILFTLAPIIFLLSRRSNEYYSFK